MQVKQLSVLADVAVTVCAFAHFPLFGIQNKHTFPLHFK